MMFREKIAVLAALITLTASAAWAQGAGPFQGTKDEQQACQRDAIRHCREASSVNDTFRVLACLQSNRSKISKACQKVLESHGQ
jgi:hypothetical protein